MSKTKRVQVSFKDKQWEILQNFKGEFGDSDADIVRNIVMAWLSEKGFISDIVRKKINENDDKQNSTVL